MSDEDGHYTEAALSHSEEDQRFCAELSVELESELGHHRLVIRKSGERVYIQGCLPSAQSVSDLKAWVAKAHPRIEFFFALNSASDEF
jgi:hypothetical protein